MDAESADALEVLKDVWRGQEQSAADIDGSTESHCRKMTDAGVGYDDYAAGDETDWIQTIEAVKTGAVRYAGSVAKLLG